MPPSRPAPASGAFAARPAQFERRARETDAARAKSLFDRLCRDGRLDAGTLTAALERAGLPGDDPRLPAIRAALGDGALSLEDFTQALDEAEAGLLERLASGGLASPNFAAFRGRVEDVFGFAAQTERGKIADYIPELAKADPEAFSMGACTIDGQRFATGLRPGDAERTFCVQSAMKPINYAAAMEMIGPDTVHRHVGREPSGQGFNSISLDAQGRPHNPMINAGAILTAGLIRPTLDMDQRFGFVTRLWSAAAAGAAPGFDAAVYDSERKTADRNRALAYFMREHGCFPEESDLEEALELYFRCCSLTVDVDRLSLVAATLANGGVCPLTERQVFQRSTVRHVLTLMLSCGMYDFSGEFAFTVGLPAKSGVAGALMIVVPGFGGFATYSPRLGPKGNSVRGVAFARALSDAFGWHLYAPIMVDPDADR